MSKECTVNQVLMSLSTYYLDDGRHLTLLHRRRRAYAPPRAIPLAMITMRKSIHGFPLVSYMGMGLRLTALRAARAPLSQHYQNLKLYLAIKAGHSSFVISGVKALI